MLILMNPPFYDTAEDMAKKIDSYFKNPPTQTAYIQGDKSVDIPDISVTGLALYLGFKDRQSLYDNQKRSKEFDYVISYAKARIENKYEFNLMHGNTTGAIFALKNMGWSDKQDVDLNLNRVDVIDFVNKQEEEQSDQEQQQSDQDE